MWAPRLLACALIAFLCVSAPAFAALSPTVTTSQIRDFTRITFNWPQKIRFKLTETGNGVTLIFSQPASIDMNAIRGSLGSRLQNSALSKDGTSITLTFDQPYRVRHFISGNANGIDILGLSDQPKKASPKPDVKSAKPENADKKDKKNAPPKVEAKKTVEKKPELKETKKEAPKTPAKPDAVEKNEEKKPAPEVVKEEKTPETKVASPKKEKASKAVAAPTEAVAVTPSEETADEVAASEKTPDDQTAETAPVPVPEPTAAPEEPETNEAADTEAPSEAPVTAQAEPVETKEKTTEAVAKPAAQKTEKTAKPSDVQASKTQTFIEEAEQAAPAVALPATSEPAPAKETPVADAPEPPDAAEAAPEVAPVAKNDVSKILDKIESADAGTSGAPFIITMKSSPAGTEIHFPWRQRTGAAVFFRDNNLWIIFDKKQDMKLGFLESILPASVTKLEQIPHPTHTILRLQTDGGVHVKTSRPKSSAEWWITLSNYQQMPSSPIMPDVRATEKSPYIFIPELEHSPALTLTDPDIGDEMVVVPFYNPGEGIYPSRDYVEMKILETAQGLAVVKKSDTARVVATLNGIRLTARDGGLSLSSDLPALALDELEALKTNYATWFPYDRWKVEPGKFVETRRELEQKMMGAGDLRGNSMRLKLAQMYLAEGMAYEALGLLDIIKAKDPGFYAQRQLAAMHGAANFLIDRNAEAAIDFKDPTLLDSRELAVWQQALSVFDKERSRFDYLDYYPEFIKKYPPRIREKLAIVAADNYINRKSYNKAIKTFDAMNASGVEPRTLPYIDFLLGKISAEQNQIDAAKSLWEPLAKQTDDRFIRARAEFALTTMLYNNNLIDAKEAMRRLEKLRVVWRGDSLELSLLNYLGQMYVDNGEYLNGLRTWRELVNQYPDSPLAGPVARAMAKTFNDLFAEGGADKLKPLEALATFYEFRELTPIGEPGDKMIQGLANRLASVDLLDRAAALLEHQLKYRQEGEARSHMGAQLALIYLFNKDPQRALNVLEVTNYGNSPETLKRKRTQLAAMGLSETGAPEKALAMLSTDASHDADILRLNIYWKTREWGRVIDMAEGLLSARKDTTVPLSPEETDYLLQLAIAYMFERNTIQLQYLRHYFSPLLADGPSKDIFTFVTDASGPIDPNKFDQVTQQISRIESFMQTYRNRVTESGLGSAVN